jgi:adenosylhomocysteine nucleosidase
MVEQSGIGDRRAEDAARRLVERGVSALASWGCAGGLDPSLGPGALVVPSSVVVSDSVSYDCDPTWRERLLVRLESEIHPVIGPMLHVEKVIVSPDQKRELHERFRVTAVDMESGAVARVAAEHGLPFLAVRVVLDGAGVRLPKVALTTPEGKSAGPAAVLLWRILRSPREWLAVYRLSRCFRVSGKAMKNVWRLAAPDLCLHSEP